jgi:hypothetical protein
MHNFDLSFIKREYSTSSDELRCKISYSFDVIGELVQIKKIYFSLSEKGHEVRYEKTFLLTGSRREDNAVIFKTNDPLKVD